MNNNEPDSPFTYSLWIDLFDPRPEDEKEFDSLEDASIAIRRRWPDAILDTEWATASATQNAEGQFERPVVAGERWDAWRFVYLDREAKNQADLAERMAAIPAILYRYSVKQE